jgi:acetylornithine deacetylase/succinyl-diaminopimelate desuccinylase-like protein
VNYRKLGRTGFEVSEMGYGAWGIGGKQWLGGADDESLAALRRAIDLRHPGLPIVPNMSAGATDSLYYRNLGVPSYGVSGLFMKPSDDFAHGLDERVPVDSIEGALLQWHSLLRDLAR